MLATFREGWLWATLVINGDREASQEGNQVYLRFEAAVDYPFPCSHSHLPRMYLAGLFLANPSVPMLVEGDKERPCGNLTMIFLSLPFSPAWPSHAQVDHCHAGDWH